MTDRRWYLCVYLVAAIGMAVMLAHAETDTHADETADLERLNQTVTDLEARAAQLQADLERESKGIERGLWDSYAQYQPDWTPPYYIERELQDTLQALEAARAERNLMLAQLQEAADMRAAEELEQEARDANRMQLEMEAAAEAERLAHAQMMADRQAGLFEMRSYVYNLTHHHVNIMLDQTCMTMQQYGIPNDCPSYVTLRDLFDNSYHMFDAWSVTDWGDIRRDRTVAITYHPALYYVTLDARMSLNTTTPLHIAVDPTGWERAMHPSVIIVPDLPAYLGQNHEIRWNADTRTKTYYYGVHITDDCMTATITADMWRETIGHALLELREGCRSAIYDPALPEDLSILVPPYIDLDTLTEAELAAYAMAYGAHPRMVLQYAESYSAPSYEFPEESAALDQLRYWERMAESCHMSWRECR